LIGLRELGFNRISIGVQSTNPQDLKRLDRIHDNNDVLKSISNARKAGFENINLDLIFGLPWQSLRSWQESLRRALDLQPDHLSIYSLIIESDTVLYDWYQKGRIAVQDQDLEADMYELTMAMLEEHGFIHYETSNWAKADPNIDFRCKHNLQYWLNLPYLGFGAGAHGYPNHERTENIQGIEDYIKRIQTGKHSRYIFPNSPAIIFSNRVDIQTQMKDFMLLGLRLISEGVSEERFRHDFGVSMKDVFNEDIQHLIGQDLIYWADAGRNQLRLTKRGVMLANQVFMTFV